MSFKYSVIGDNTPENKEWIKKIGWELKYMREDADTIVTSSNTGLFSCIVSDQTTWFSNFISKGIDCRKNPDLFKAISAMRHGSDYMQWFTDGNIWVLCNQSDFRYEVSIPTNILKDLHKATLSELKKHFNSIKFTWNDLQERINKMTEEQRNRQVWVQIEDEGYARKIEDVQFTEVDIFENIKDSDERGSLDDLKDLHGDDFEIDNYKLRTPKGTPFLWDGF